MSNIDTTISEKEYKEIYNSFSKDELVNMIITKTYQVIELRDKNLKLIIENNKLKEKGVEK